MWDGFGGNAYPISRLIDFYKEAILDKNVELVRDGDTNYFNIPCSFDIEVSSWKEKEVHLATMYIWQFGLNGSVIYGRTWDEWGQLLEYLQTEMRLTPHQKLVIYVHNLGYEFQFIRKFFDWDKVFAIKQRRPVYAICGGFEFRCSLFLSNYALAYIGKHLLFKYPVEKMVGDLDYSLKRNSLTPLTPKELKYCINDVRVVMSYIQEKIEQDGDITQIPLTNTGYVRNYCRQECFYEDSATDEERRATRMNYLSLMKALQVDSEDEYKMMKDAFMGGFTHASCLYSGQILRDVGSADLTSSYPYTMVAQYFPMSKGEYIGNVSDKSVLKYYLDKYCCLFGAEFVNIRPRVDYENIISESRCLIKENAKVNNGRVISADRIYTVLTELDFESITRFYIWDSLKVINLRVYRRGYLPKSLILSVLDLYENKTKLKGITGKEIEYLVSKNMINAAFGMMVTAIIRDEFEYTNTKGWTTVEADVISQLNKYNTNFNRFLYYGWGVWVTAHARHNLFSAIYEFGADYVYSDTDSIKAINFNDHLDYFKEYNRNVQERLLRMCAHYDIDFEKVQPKNNKGVRKMIGVWEMEEGYNFFKAVGAKRYIYENRDGTLGLTVSGLNKKFAIPYLLWKFGGGDSEENESIASEWGGFIKLARIAYDSDNPESKEAMQVLLSMNLSYIPIFAYFGDGLYVPAGHTGKQTLDYIDAPIKAIMEDYLGIPALVEEESAIYMEPQSYLMSQTTDYLEFLSGVQTVNY